uniref:Integrase catalytic domain-containing protein n=1 Tax=Tanacetum cinerariifolium TaxID=118510 RepID=A0A6L2M7A5_TANCI|nr:hypothetical protein [Tanacetum cinerariifolium]
MSTSASKLILLCILLLLFANVRSLETTSYRGVRAMERGANSSQFLNELVLELSQLKNYNRRKMVDTARVAPGGPDGNVDSESEVEMVFDETTNLMASTSFKGESDRDKFEGQDFRGWQKKMHFLLTTLKMVYVLTTPMPELLDDAKVKAIRIRAKWENDDYICRGHIVNGMSGSLSDVYTNVESAKELWDSLESKYMAEDSSSKKFPDLKHTLKHGKDDMSLVQLGSHLRIIKSLREQDIDKGKGKVVGGPSVNMTEEGPVDSITWWIDSGATTYVCKDRCWFKTYEPVEDGSVLYMGDDHFAHVHGKGNVALEFSSRKTIILFNVLYVPKLRKNLVSGPMLNKCGYKLVYESDKYILSKSGIIHETTSLYTPQQNDVPEKKNKALKEMVNSMLSYSGLSEGFWGEAMLTACYLLNRIPNKRNKTTPYELWFYIIKPNDSVFINLIIESIYAIFDENRFSSIPRPKEIIPNSDESQRDDLSDDVPNEIPEPRKEDPRTYNEAMQSRDSAFWKKAINDEIGSIMENNTWFLSDLPPGCKPLGFRQKEGIDYFDTYAPVSCITTIRLLLDLASIHNLVIHQMDVKTAFSNGDFEKEVYMKQPEGFIMPGNEHKVYKLVKSLYGLKQAPKQWHQNFDEVVLSSGFHLNQSDKCVYSKFDDSDKGFIICLYVDDMLIFGTDQNQVDKTKKFLSSRFSMKDMGEADIILGIKIKRENQGIVITQSHYIEKILKKFNCEVCSLVSTPMDLVEKLKLNTVKPVDQLKYSRAIGCLMYVMTNTTPDIAYDVGRLSRFTSNPSRQHWKAITRVFKYLRGTKDYGLSYVGYPSVLEGYSDASWINHVEDSSSTSGWVFLLGGGVIS